MSARVEFLVGAFIFIAKNLPISLQNRGWRWRNKGLPTCQYSPNAFVIKIKTLKFASHIIISFFHFISFVSFFHTGKLSRCPYRAATETYIPEIGYQLHRMLIALKLDLRSLNCIGHSLGSHIVRIIVYFILCTLYLFGKIKQPVLRFILPIVHSVAMLVLHRVVNSNVVLVSILIITKIMSQQKIN